MRNPVEIYFSGGQNTSVAQDLLLATGEVQSLVNADLSILGMVRPGKSFEVVTEYPDDVHSLIPSAGGGNLFIGAGEKVYHYGNHVALLDNMQKNPLSGVDYAGWMYLCSGSRKKKIYLTDPSISYDWGVNNPTEAAEVSAASDILNGGFDENVRHWTAGNDALLESKSSGQEGNCLRITETGTANPYAEQEWDTNIGTIYTVRLYVRAGTEATWRASKKDTDGTDVVWFNGAAGGQEATSKFVEHILNFTATDTVSKVVLEQICTAGAGTYILYDSVTCDPNLIENGTFDSDTTGWTAENAGVLASVAGGEDGNCLRITTGASDNPGAYQDLTTVEDRTYTISVYVKEGTVGIGFDIWKEDLDGTNIVHLTVAGVATAAFVEHTLSFTATSTTSRLHLESTSTGGSGETILFDTITDATSYRPDGVYNCYYSWVAEYDDESEYETDLSPAVEIRVNNKRISWELPVSAVTEITKKRLYREKSGVIYFVTELDNDDVFYIDDLGDADLILQDVFDRTGYYPPPDDVWKVEEHYRRLFCLLDNDSDFSNYLFWSEPEEPQAFIFDSDTGLYSNSTDVFRKGDECTGIVSWGGDLFISSKSTFKRLVGSSPSYWSLRPTLATTGNVAKYAMCATKYGILHVWWDGIYLFNAYNTTRISGKNKAFFETINWNQANSIRAVSDESTYRLFVPVVGETYPQCFVMDFETYPKIRCYQEDLNLSNGYFVPSTNERWYVDGNRLGVRNGSTPQAFEVHSKGYATHQLMQLDGVAKLHYEIDTNGEDVDLTFYFDGQPVSPIVLNTNGKVRNVVSVPISQARTVSLKVSGTISDNVRIYEPWILE